MNIPLLSAGIVAAVGCLLHALGGEYNLLRHIQGRDLPYMPGEDGDTTRRYIRGFWHIFTVDLLLSAVTLIYVAVQNPGPAYILLVQFIALHFICYTLVIWGLSLSRPVAFVRTITQWVSFLAIALLAFWGTR